MSEEYETNEVPDEYIADMFQEDPAGWITLFLNHIPEDRRAEAIRGIREMLEFFHPAPTNLPKNAILILRTLDRAQSPMIQVELEDATRLSRKTIGSYLERLMALQLIHRPSGARQGVAITGEGRNWLGTNSAS
ncbi:MAG: hypothetical protein IH987_02155 [Planctomycetes bacterium]|nr:hypothetical protein [Planctomycetota bacterium]